jgi:hypothetical protein
VRLGCQYGVQPASVALERRSIQVLFVREVRVPAIVSDASVGSHGFLSLKLHLRMVCGKVIAMAPTLD